MLPRACLAALALAAASCGGSPQTAPQPRSDNAGAPRPGGAVLSPAPRSHGGVTTGGAASADAAPPGAPGEVLASEGDEAPDVAGKAPEAAVVKERSSLLPSGFYNPMPGGVFAGYRADTGLDIAGSPRPVYAIAAGTLDYSEPGHTLWTGPRDTANCVRFKLDAPIAWKGRQITHVYYAHLSSLDYHQAEGSKERRHIEGGERLGLSGVARGSPHLHIGLLLDGEVEQYSGTFLFEDEIRELLGGYKNGKKLPALID